MMSMYEYGQTIGRDLFATDFAMPDVSEPSSEDVVREEAFDYIWNGPYDGEETSDFVDGYFGAWEELTI